MKKFVLFLTVFRIFAGPFIFALVFFFDAILLGLLFFVAASLSDFLDGKLARSFNVESSLGAILDPIADKILILFALFTITLLTNDLFVGGMSALILAREFWVSSLREYAAQHSKTELTKVTMLAKFKTSVQFLAISVFFLGLGINNALIIFLASFLLFLALLTTLKTGLDYSLNLFKS
ncbi:MAG: CDP-alcohol phosphatidyltransferase family protein [Gammaproteobacteria bacterium]